MKKIAYVVAVVVLAVLVVVLLHHWLMKLNDPGFLILGIGGWSIETSFVLFVLALVVSFMLFYALFRGLGWVMRLPGQLAQRRKNIKFNRSNDSLIAGLIDSAEGNWERAEKTLIKYAAHSGAPLLHYLSAARAAQSRGNIAKRDEYLRQAATQSPGSDMIVGLTQAELHLSENQFEQALQTLSKLHSINPTHATVLKLLHGVYKKLGDWQGLQRLLPVLSEQKILVETEVLLLEAETYSLQLQQAADSGNIANLQAVWEQTPEHMRNKPGIAILYFTAMVDAGMGANIEEALVNTLNARWNANLLTLYARVQSNDPLKQLQIAERWLPAHPADALLLCVVGELSMRQGDLVQAEQYLTRSVGQEPSAKALRLLGDTLNGQGELERALAFYKQGLELAAQA